MNGTPNFEEYSYDALLDAYEAINESKYPENKAMVARLLEERKGTEEALIVIKEQEDAKLRRPKLVWLISIFTLLGPLISIVFIYMYFFGALGLTPELEASLNRLTLTDYALTLLVTSANTIGTIQLFRLKASAFMFLLGALIVNTFMHILSFINNSYPYTVTSSEGRAGAYFGFVIALAIVMYAWNLKEKKVLS